MGSVEDRPIHLIISELIHTEHGNLDSLYKSIDSQGCQG